MNKNISNKDFYGKLVKLILPMTLQNFMFALIPVSDTLMLVTLDQDQMSAVSLASQAMFVLNMFLYALISGMSMFAAQYWGKKDIKSIEKILGYTLRITLPMVFIFAAMALFCPLGIMRIFTDVPSIIEYGIGYLKFVALAYILDGLAQVLAAILKNVELVKESTIISVFMVVTNIGLNAVFIFGLLGAPAMGARGAALATTITSAVGFIGALVILKMRSKVQIDIRHILHTDPELRNDFSKYSGPLLANNLFWGLGFTMISVIIGHLGGDAVAANAVAAQVKDLVSCFCFALAAGGSIVVGNELGAGNLDTAKDYGDRLFKISVISGLILGAITAALTPVILAMVDLTPTAEKYLMWMLLMCLYYIMGRSINSVVISGIFAAGGDTKFGMICDTVTMWCFIVPIGALLAFVIKIPVVWVCFFLYLDEMVKIPVVYKHYKKYRWVKNLVDKDQETTAEA